MVDLSKTEFELLQLIVHSKGIDKSKIVERMPAFDPLAINNAILSLIRKGLVRRATEQIFAKPQALEALEPYRVKRAVILGAGKGERMRPETHTIPKPMVKIHQKRLIETQLDALANAGITDITIIRGYLGEVYDLLLPKYPQLKFIDNPYWDTAEAIVSTYSAIELLAGAYLIEGDLYIKNNGVLRPYEYHSTYCGIPGKVENDWHFYIDKNIRITHLAHGYSNDLYGAPHRFVGIMYWTPEEADKLKKDIQDVVARPNNQHRFIESVPFDKLTDEYTIHARALCKDDIVEIDTYQELQDLRYQERRK